MVNDIIADSLTRIRNASMRRLESTTLYYARSLYRFWRYLRIRVLLRNIM